MTTPRSPVLVLAGLLLAASGYLAPAAAEAQTAPAKAPTPPAEAKSIHAVFACDDGKSVDATFTNGESSGVALKLSDGRQIFLPQAASASGARYANGNESFVFWNKGNTAFIDEDGKATFTGCITKDHAKP